MVVGQRGENLEQKTIRHFKEMKDEMDCWKNEFTIAKNGRNTDYEDFCIMMIRICENTISYLEDFAADHYITLSK